jgi:predicted RNA-binding protein with PUA-like domain
MAKRYWLMKSEPDVFGIDNLEMAGTTDWDGVRNFQARNLMRDDMKVGDGVLYYHSNANPPGVAGVARVSKEAHPDPTAWDKKSKYFDEKSTRDDPRWFMVSIDFVEKFSDIVPLPVLKASAGLEDMMVIRKGARLSVQPVTKKEFDIVVKMGRSRR